MTALLEGWADADDPPDEARFFAWLDARPFLVGEHQVCAGTRAQIRRLFHALADDTTPTTGAARDAGETIDEVKARDAGERRQRQGNSKKKRRRLTASGSAATKGATNVEWDPTMLLPTDKKK